MVISAVGVVSLVVVVVSVGAMVLHYRVLKRRGAVDESFAVLDDLLRLQLEIIYEAAEGLPTPEDISEIKEMCEVFSEYETYKLSKALPKLRKAASLGEHEELSATVSETETAAAELSRAIEKYNDYAATFPACLMISILGLEVSPRGER
ncbi:MAG: hypothetical protein FWB96_11905 [Defluviitaleaceae bacterium]|nr:hypothetical protein [Defluviitaleaceae bacterium]MCL2263808.1 hypothetical protein [Defluviitaleaceae bacterium]